MYDVVNRLPSSFANPVRISDADRRIEKMLEAIEWI